MLIQISFYKYLAPTERRTPLAFTGTLFVAMERFEGGKRK